MARRSPTLRPFFTYYGGKWRAAKHYPEPEHERIIEPFAGSAGYSLRYPDRKVVLVERDEKVAATWRYLLNVSEAEVLGLPDIGAGETVDDLDVCPEARLLIGWWLNKGCAVPCKRQSSWMRRVLAGEGGKNSRGGWWGDKIRQRIAGQLECIRHWRLIHGDYTDVPNVNATWFVDPPYEKAGKHYRHGCEGIDFDALGQWCRERRGTVVVCENEGASWLPFRPFRAIKSTERKGGGRKSFEAIWVQRAGGLAGSHA